MPNSRLRSADELGADIAASLSRGGTNEVDRLDHRRGRTPPPPISGPTPRRLAVPAFRPGPEQVGVVGPAAEWGEVGVLEHVCDVRVALNERLSQKHDGAGGVAVGEGSVVFGGGR